MTADVAMSVVFLHAHPDDEAIFTGATIAARAAAGLRDTVVFATDGAAAFEMDGLAALRRTEADEAARILGVRDVEYWDFADSGVDGTAAGPQAFCRADISIAVAKLCRTIESSGADLVVSYEPNGVYGHPDHLMCHRVAAQAAARSGIEMWEVTVDREHLHFVETHLLEGPLGVSPRDARVGHSSVEIVSSFDLVEQVDTKIAAIAAHRSQVPATMRTNPEAVRETYRWEWYLHQTGSIGLL